MRFYYGKYYASIHALCIGTIDTMSFVIEIDCDAIESNAFFSFCLLFHIEETLENKMRKIIFIITNILKCCHTIEFLSINYEIKKNKFPLDSIEFNSF